MLIKLQQLIYGDKSYIRVFRRGSISTLFEKCFSYNERLSLPEHFIDKD